LFAAVSSLLYARIKSRLNFVTIYGVAFLNMGNWLCPDRFGEAGLCCCGLAIAGSGLGLRMHERFVSNIDHSQHSARASFGESPPFSWSISLPIGQPTLSQLVGLKLTYGVAGGIMALAAMHTVVISRWR